MSEVDYIDGYYNELNPENVKFSLLTAGLAANEIDVACELGIGLGLSLNIHAAASDVAWYGNDFIPSQVASASEAAKASGARICISDESFKDFCTRSDLPDFDFIGLHGIWSWVSQENRAYIIDFLAKKLKVGGVAYVSYNALPGWVAATPMRHLLTEYVECYGSTGAGIEKNISQALDFFGNFVSSDTVINQILPTLQTRFEEIKNKDRRYIAHEYFNRDWEPMYFSQVASLLGEAKLSFATSAYYPDMVPRLNYDEQHDAVLAGISDPIFRETVKDYVMNRQFRRDYWVKGPRSISGTQQVRMLSDMSVAISKHPDEIELEVKTDARSVKLLKDIYQPLLDELADKKTHSLGDLFEALGKKGLDVSRVAQAVGILKSKGDLCFIQNQIKVSSAKETSNKLNNYLLGRAEEGNVVPYIANPASGGAFQVNRLEQLFIKFINEGDTSRVSVVKKTWQLLKSRGEKIIDDGKQLNTAEENVIYLERLANDFFTRRLPLLRAQLILS